jgi:peptidyl-prolyl cis-trans isomerase A (cyclophilin A)
MVMPKSAAEPAVMATFRVCCLNKEILLKVHLDRAPATGTNFCDYVRLGLLKDSTFFRILGPRNQRGQPYPVCVIQGGVPYSPRIGYEPFKGLGPIRHETTSMTGLRHRDGTVTMARFGPGQTYGSFCICVGDQPHLDYGGGRFADGQGAAAFGEVIGGTEVIQALSDAIEESEFVSAPIVITSIEPVG